MSKVYTVSYTNTPKVYSAKILAITEQSSILGIELFYLTLTTAIKEHALKNCVIMGDFNTKVKTPRNRKDIVLSPCSKGKKQEANKI